mmetsp:Transcript_11674/g.15532  ORF Transcript_11674/g.15532 Transcript_11674/m.15532 type:complete len:266 (-) Transcript_11674:35-832(-)
MFGDGGHHQSLMSTLDGVVLDNNPHDLVDAPSFAFSFPFFFSLNLIAFFYPLVGKFPSNKNSLHFAHLRWYPLFVEFTDFFLLLLVIISLLTDPGGLFVLTPLHKFVFLVLSATYSLDFGIWVELFLHRASPIPEFLSSGVFTWMDFLHHVGGMIGLFVLLYQDFGGGMIVRLLLDLCSSCVLDYYFFSRRYPNTVPEMSPELCTSLHYICFFVFRMLWYPFVMIFAMVELWSSFFYSDFVMTTLVLWFAFSFVFHFVMIQTVNG